MKRILAILLLASLFPQLNLYALSSDEHMKEVRNLMDEGQYKSAWTYLHQYAEEIELSRMIICKSELCIRYYATTNLHQMFAFADLAPGETLNDIRRRNSMEDMKLFNPGEALETLLRENPGNSEIPYWLGEYYFGLLHLFGTESGLGEGELGYRIIISYRLALDGGWEDENLYANLAYTEMTLGEWSSAALHFEKASHLNPHNPAYHYQGATACMRDNQLEEADRKIRLALPLYHSDKSRADALFLGSTIALMQDNAEETLAYLKEGRTLCPGDYRFPERLIQVYLVEGKRDEALENAVYFFDLHPESPESCQTIMNHYNAFNRLNELVPFFEKQIPLYSDRPEALGNLYYHQGVVSLLTGKEDLAEEQLELARGAFSRVFSADHQIFGIIEELKEKIREE